MGKPKNFQHSQFNWICHWRGSIDDIVTCPYDSTHCMPYRRLQIHIIQCQKIFETKYPKESKNFVICPYNTLHRFPKDQLQNHLIVCKEHMMSLHSRLTSGKPPYIERKQPEKLTNLSEEDQESFDPKDVEEWEWMDML